MNERASREANTTNATDANLFQDPAFYLLIHFSLPMASPQVPR